MSTALICVFALSYQAQGQSIKEQAVEAARHLERATQEMRDAISAHDRVSALTKTIRGYEAGMATMRAALRQVQGEYSHHQHRITQEENKIARLLATLSQVESASDPAFLLHPDGPVAAVRTAMLLSDATQTLRLEVRALESELRELQDLQEIQDAAHNQLAQSLANAQEARTALSIAISERRRPPRRFVEDTTALRQLIEAGDTLTALSEEQVTPPLPETNAPSDAPTSFQAAKGTLPLPVLGRILRKPFEAGASGVRRPGLTLATRPGALVTAPWPATIRYKGEISGYGDVLVLEPQKGYLMIFAHMSIIYGEPGEILPQGAALGFVEGVDPGLHDDLISPSKSLFTKTSPKITNSDGVNAIETLYIEIRQGAEPIDPLPWFAALTKQELK